MCGLFVECGSFVSPDENLRSTNRESDLGAEAQRRRG